MRMTELVVKERELVVTVRELVATICECGAKGKDFVVTMCVKLW